MLIMLIRSKREEAFVFNKGRMYRSAEVLIAKLLQFLCVIDSWDKKKMYKRVSESEELVTEKGREQNWKIKEKVML